MKDLHNLLEGYYDASLTDDEEFLLEEKIKGSVTIDKYDGDVKLIEALTNNNTPSIPKSLTFDNMLSRQNSKVKSRLFFRFIPYAAVAALLMIFGSMALSLHNKQKEIEQEILNNAINQFCNAINQSDSTLNSVASVLTITLDKERDNNLINNN